MRGAGGGAGGVRKPSTLQPIYPKYWDGATSLEVCADILNGERHHVKEGEARVSGAGDGGMGLQAST